MFISRVLAFLALQLSAEVALAEDQGYRDDSECSSPNGNGGYDCYTCPGEPMTCNNGCNAVYEREVSNTCPQSGAMIKYNCMCPGSPATKTALIIISIVVCCCIFLVLIWGVQPDREAAVAVHPERGVAGAIKAQEVQPAASTDGLPRPYSPASVRHPSTFSDG